MNEQVEQSVSGPGVSHQGAPVQLTGHDTVDEVLRSLDDLENRPLDEHVAVFDSAHEALRSALSDAADQPRGSGAG